jgi:uncharacterized membrane protein (UPF0127 family)
MSNHVMQHAIDGRMVRLAIARTWRERMHGLAYTARSDWHGIDGMYFTFPFAWRWPIWMRGMQFSIDALWFRDGLLVDQHDALSRHDPWRICRPCESANCLIELVK